MHIRVLQGVPSKLLLLKKVMCLGWNLKLPASIGGLTMLEGMKFESGIAKSLNGVVAGSMLTS